MGPARPLRISGWNLGRFLSWKTHGGSNAGMRLDFNACDGGDELIADVLEVVELLKIAGLGL